MMWGKMKNMWYQRGYEDGWRDGERFRNNLNEQEIKKAENRGQAAAFQKVLDWIDKKENGND